VWKVSIHPSATLEAREARLWYLARKPLVLNAFMAELDAAVAMIAEAPDRWPERPDGRRRS